MSGTKPRDDSVRPERRRRSDGERTRRAILEEAARLATVEGIEGLSIARLAQAVGMSKSGLFAHFGSKDELQLATIETASELFDEQVVQPALAEPTGLERLVGLTERFLAHVESNVYPGGCFFASVAAEMDTHTGPVRDRAIEAVDGWLEQLEVSVREAQAEGALDPAEDPAQLAFELEGAMLAANAQYVMYGGSPAPLERCRRARDRVLARAAAPPRAA
jgi:AcrR family transcriptional regulator